MILKSLSLENFRTYSKLYLEFCKNINIIYGENGIGKTNILEAIYLSCITKLYSKKLNSTFHLPLSPSSENHL